MSDTIERKLKREYTDRYRVLIAGNWAIFNHRHSTDMVWIYCLCHYGMFDMDAGLSGCWSEDTKFIANGTGSDTCKHCHSEIPNRVHLLSKLIKAGR
jgi:hypothetical protein